MKLATLRNGTRDGRLVVVSRDLTRATDVARRMITDYGMSERFRNVALTKRGAGMMGAQAEQVMVREYGEETQRYIDDTLAATIAERYARALELVRSKRGILDELAAELLDKETVDEARFKALMGTA